MALSVVHGQSPVYFKTGLVHGEAVCFFIAAFVACGGRVCVGGGGGGAGRGRFFHGGLT